MGLLVGEQGLAGYISTPHCTRGWEGRLASPAPPGFGGLVQNGGFISYLLGGANQEDRNGGLSMFSRGGAATDLTNCALLPHPPTFTPPSSPPCIRAASAKTQGALGGRMPAWRDGAWTPAHLILSVHTITPPPLSDAPCCDRTLTAFHPSYERHKVARIATLWDNRCTIPLTAERHRHRRSVTLPALISSTNAWYASRIAALLRAAVRMPSPSPPASSSPSGLLSHRHSGLDAAPWR